MKTSPLLLTLTALLTLTPTPTHAAPTESWTESLHGDLSDLHTSPTPVPISLGDNLITGRMGSLPNFAFDADIFTFQVPFASILTSINLVQFEMLEDVGGGSFFAISAGTSIDPNSPSRHLSNLLIESPGELFPRLANPTYAGPGIRAPLPAGNYTLWFQELSTPVNYQFSLTLSPVVIPEPSTTLPLLTLPALLTARLPRPTSRGPSRLRPQ